MNFQRLNYFLKLINDFQKIKHTARHVAASGHATCYADVSMTSARGQQMLMSALTWSTLTKPTVNGFDQANGQRVHFSSGSAGPTCQWHRVTDGWGPHIRVFRKRKRIRFKGFSEKEKESRHHVCRAWSSCAMTSRAG